MESIVHDEVIDVSMEPIVARGYNAWWLGVHPTIMGMDKDEEGEEEATSEASSKDYPYQVNNPMHDVPMQEEGGRSIAPGLMVLAKAMPLATPGKGLNHVKKNCNFKHDQDSNGTSILRRGYQEAYCRS